MIDGVGDVSYSSLGSKLIYLTVSRQDSFASSLDPSHECDN